MPVQLSIAVVSEMRLEMAVDFAISPHGPVRDGRRRRERRLVGRSSHDTSLRVKGHVRRVQRRLRPQLSLSLCGFEGTPGRRRASTRSRPESECSFLTPGPGASASRPARTRIRSVTAQQAERATTTASGPSLASDVVSGCYPSWPGEELRLGPRSAVERFARLRWLTGGPDDEVGGHVTELRLAGLGPHP